MCPCTLGMNHTAILKANLNTLYSNNPNQIAMVISLPQIHRLATISTQNCQLHAGCFKMAPTPRSHSRLPLAESKKSLSVNPIITSKLILSKSTKQRSSAKSKKTSSATSAVLKSRSAEDHASEHDEVMDDPADLVPEAAHGEVTRDSAEIIEGASEFKTGLTRDMAEVREHKMAEEAAANDPLPQCRFGGESEPLKPIDVQQLEASGCGQKSCGTLGTPGDIDNEFAPDRAESPASAKRFEMQVEVTPLPSYAGETSCKKRRKTTEYVSFWGSSNALGQWTKNKVEMKRKRKLLEKMHAKNRWLREKMRQRAREKRKMLRCRDQSKIPESRDDITINKTYYFRFSYNHRVPCMPSTMSSHFEKFKKPPFKHFQKGFKACYKQVDEFEKLRVCDKKKK